MNWNVVKYGALGIGCVATLIGGIADKNIAEAKAEATQEKLFNEKFNNDSDKKEEA